MKRNNYSNLPSFLKLNDLKCDDEFIGYLYKNDEFIHFIKRDDYDELFVNNDNLDEYLMDEKVDSNFKKVFGHETIDYKKLCIILESPHKQEFLTNKISEYKGNIRNSRPANGQTGRKIEEYLVTIFKDFFDEKLKNNECYTVSIINSIQYQCSQGVNTFNYRDRIWIHKWIKNEDYFLERIKKLNPDLILNCTTKASHYKSKKSGVFYDKESDPRKFFRKKFLKKEYNLTIAKEEAENYILAGYEEKKDKRISIRSIVEYSLLVNQYINETSDNYRRTQHPCNWHNPKSMDVYKLNEFNSENNVIKYIIEKD